ncbi:unnamed protein product [Closterium sp. NIES-65]|nr:unnamed protein product [Closterium sp. NIES-65]
MKSESYLTLIIPLGSLLVHLLLRLSPPSPPPSLPSLSSSFPVDVLALIRDSHLTKLLSLSLPFVPPMGTLHVHHSPPFLSSLPPSLTLSLSLPISPSLPPSGRASMDPGLPSHAAHRTHLCLYSSRAYRKALVPTSLKPRPSSQRPSSPAQLSPSCNWQTSALAPYNLFLSSLHPLFILSSSSLHPLFILSSSSLLSLSLSFPLRSTAFALLQLADIRPGDIVLDPMCGCGTLPLEAADWLKSCVSAFGGDKDAGAVDAAATNSIAWRTALANSKALGIAAANGSALRISAANQGKEEAAVANGDAARRSQKGHVAGCDWLVWDASALPLRTGCVDRVLCDMPFGVRCGEWFEVVKSGDKRAGGKGRGGEGKGEEVKEEEDGKDGVARVLTPGTGTYASCCNPHFLNCSNARTRMCQSHPTHALITHTCADPRHWTGSADGGGQGRTGSADGGGEGRLAVLMAVGRGVRAAVEGLSVCLREKQRLAVEMEPDSSLAFSSALIHGAISTRKGGLSGIEPIASAAESPLVSPNTSLSFDAIRIVSPPTVPIFPPLSLLFSLSLPHPACQSGSSSTPCPCSFNVYVCAAAEHCHVLVSQAEERREAKGSDDNTAATDLVFEVEVSSN